MTPGVCIVCGCTESTPCAGGCIWANSSATLCSSCTGGSYIIGAGPGEVRLQSINDDEFEECPETMAALIRL